MSAIDLWLKKSPLAQDLESSEEVTRAIERFGLS